MMMTDVKSDRQRILDQAIALASESSWDSLNLTQLADSLECPVADIGRHFRSKDDLAEAFFDQADRAVWALASDEAFRKLSCDEKLHKCIITWLESFSSTKPLVKDMLAYKFEPGHFHLQAHGITRISRTVQWFLDVSEREYGGLKQIADEFAVTSAYLTTLSCFLYDKSESNRNTRNLLKRLIQQIDRGHDLFSLSVSSNRDFSVSGLLGLRDRSEASEKTR